MRFLSTLTIMVLTAAAIKAAPTTGEALAARAANVELDKRGHCKNCPTATSASVDPLQTTCPAYEVAQCHGSAIKADSLATLYSYFDALDLDNAMPYLDPCCQLVFANQPAVYGHEAIRAAFGGLFTVLESMKHTVIQRIDKDRCGGTTIVLEASVRYVTKIGGTWDIPVVTMLERSSKKGLITSMHIYIDVSEMLASLAPK